MSIQFDLYRTPANNRARYWLGCDGDKLLVVVGLNPSVATNEKSDLTAAKVKHISRAAGYDGFAIVNLYPQRSTLPQRLHRRC